MAAPGNYQVRLVAEGKSLAVPLELKADPRVNVSAADLQKEFDLQLQMRYFLLEIQITAIVRSVAFGRHASVRIALSE